MQLPVDFLLYNRLYLLKHGGVVSYSSKRQPIIACSSFEIEYTTLCQATKETIWLRLFELELEGNIFLIMLKTDNKGLITLTFNPEFYVQIKHISAKIHYICEVVVQRDMKLKWIEKAKNLADLFTKPLDCILFQHCLEATKLKPMQAYAEGDVLEG